MESLDETSFFYNEVINFIDLNDHELAINFIKRNIDILKNPEDIALAYLNCGFLNHKLGDYFSAIDDFSKAIIIESELEVISQRSKDISFSGRSNSRYKNGLYKEAIEDRRKAKKIRLLEIDRFPDSSKIKIDYKNILLGTFAKSDLEPKYKTLIKVSKIERSRYDLISDYKKLLTNKRKEEVISKLELLSESKYEFCDYKASIRALRRADKYY